MVFFLRWDSFIRATRSKFRCAYLLCVIGSHETEVMIAHTNFMRTLLVMVSGQTNQYQSFCARSSPLVQIRMRNRRLLIGPSVSKRLFRGIMFEFILLVSGAYHITSRNAPPANDRPNAQGHRIIYWNYQGQEPTRDYGSGSYMPFSPCPCP